MKFWRDKNINIWVVRIGNFEFLFDGIKFVGIDKKTLIKEHNVMGWKSIFRM